MSGTVAAVPVAARPQAPVREWDVAFALPNLQLARAYPGQHRNVDSTDLVEAGMSLGSEWMEIVPPFDARVQRAADRNPIVKHFIGCFRDEYGRPIAPSVLIAAADAPIENSREAVSAFRNVIAVCTVLLSRASWAGSDVGHHPNWSDYFDFHPTRIGAHGLITVSAALTGLHADDDGYIGMPSPHAPDRVDVLVRDGYLYRSLSSEWRRRYQGGRRKSAYARALFRSLEVAYNALSTPTKQGGSTQEWGLQVAQWVSALEILAWLDHKYANQNYVLALFQALSWMESRSLTARRYSIRQGKQRIRVNAIQKICALMYEARNAFMHGNRLTRRTLMPWGEKGRSLPSIAPTIYRTALKAFLARRYDASRSWVEDDNSLADYLDEVTYMQAIRRTIGLAQTSSGEEQ